MIKYPVKVDDVHPTLVKESDNSIVCEAFSEGEALEIVNALNAMNKFPDIGNEFFNCSILDWYNKFIKE
jgi:hypothetical protein